MKKKVLIIGNTAREYALAKHMSQIFDVFVAPGSVIFKEFAECLDIREDNSKELLEFVLENQIDLTIPVSAKSLNTDIVDLFNIHKQPIFGSSRFLCKSIHDKFTSKKIMYKLKIPTPKFGIFDKENAVYDYTKNQAFPLVIKTNEMNSATILTSQQQLKKIMSLFFSDKNARVLIEDYIYGIPFCYYTITDGYKALPIGSSLLFKHSLEGEGGQLTSGMGACSPNYKLSQNQECFIMDSVIYPVLQYFQRNDASYVGILGVNGIIEPNGNIQILGLKSFMQDADICCILNNLDENLFDLFYSCAIGSFSDEIDVIRTNNYASVAVVLRTIDKKQNSNIITLPDVIDENTLITLYPNITKNKYLEYEVQSTGPVLAVTSCAGNIARAKNKVYQEIQSISFNGMSYRKDICMLNESELSF